MSPLLCRSRYCRPEEFGGPRQSETGRPICRQCADRLQPDLARLASMWPDLRAAVTVEGKGGEKVTGTKTPGLIINEAASDLSLSLAAWTYAILARNIELSRDGFRIGSDAGTVLRWLAKYHAWRLAYDEDHDWALWVVENAEWFRREVRRVAYPSGARRVSVNGARCQAVVLVMDDAEPPAPAVDENGHIVTRRCGGQLYALVRHVDTRTIWELLCDQDEDHRIPSSEWARYARQMEASGGGDDRGVPDGGGDRPDHAMQRQNGL